MFYINQYVYWLCGLQIKGFQLTYELYYKAMILY